MNTLEQLRKRMADENHTWLITGVAGFIGSNLLEALLRLDQRVVGLDNFSTGHPHNLDQVRASVVPEQWANFQFIEGDIRNLDDCQRAMHFAPASEAQKAALRASEPSKINGNGAAAGVPSSPAGEKSQPFSPRGKGWEGGALEHENSTHYPVEYVLHQAALGSVPRSIEDPILTNANNIDGFLNMLVASRDAKVKRFVYAASSSTYGDHPGLPKVEDKIGKPLSPYAVTKYVNELYADVFARAYGLESIGLRYFNVFGKRQDPEGAYAAVIPKWIASLIKNEPVYINGDGETSRDFCYIDNVVQINLLAAMTENPEATNQIYNVAVGDRTTLNQLYQSLRENLIGRYPHLSDARPIYRDFRSGDVRHSQADISKAKTLLGYSPEYRVGEGLKEAMEWYVGQHY